MTRTFHLVENFHPLPSLPRENKMTVLKTIDGGEKHLAVLDVTSKYRLSLERC